MLAVNLLMKSMFEAQELLTILPLNLGVANTLLASLSTLEKVIQNLDEAHKDENARVFDDLETVVNEIMRESSIVVNRSTRKTKYSRLCQALVARSTHIKLETLLQRFNTNIYSLVLAKIYQAKTRKPISVKKETKRSEVDLESLIKAIEREFRSVQGESTTASTSSITSASTGILSQHL